MRTGKTIIFLSKLLKKFTSRAVLVVALFSFVATVTEAYGTSKKVSICHATGSATNQFVSIEVSVNTVPAYLRHGNVQPVNAICPGAPGGIDPPAATPEPITMLLFGAGLALG